jgi:hypothetical protein
VVSPPPLRKAVEGEKERKAIQEKDRREERRVGRE